MSEPLLTPVLNAKREILVRTRRSAAGAASFSVAIYGAQVFAGAQSGWSPTIGIDANSALPMVAVLAVIVVGLVLADKSANPVREISSGSPAYQRRESARTQASALVFSDTLAWVSVFTAFIGFGALANAFQRVFRPVEAAEALEIVQPAFIVAGIAWVFMLLAAANVKSPAEVMARAAYGAEIYALAATRRQAWQARWLHNRTGFDVLSDSSLRAIQGRSQKPAMLATASVFFVNSVAFFVYFIVTHDGDGSDSIFHRLNFLSTAVLPAALFALFGAIAQFPLRRAVVSLRNGRRWRCAWWIVIAIACVSPALAAAAIADQEHWLIPLVIYIAVFVASWTLYCAPHLTIVTFEVGADPVAANTMFGLAALQSAVREQLRSAPLPTKPENHLPPSVDSAVVAYLMTGLPPARHE